MVLAILASGDAVGDRLLSVLTEQLKLPLLQIARQAELASTQQDLQALSTIQHTADMALYLIDSYLLSVRLQSQPTLELEPVSVSALLTDTAHHLSRLARQYDYELEVQIAGKYSPVMAHRRSLEAALSTLAYSFIEMAPQTDKRRTLVLGVHRRSDGLATGVFGDQGAISADTLRRGRALAGSARQPLPSVSSSAGAGLFVADTLLSHMNAPLYASRHNKLAGLAATLTPSQQLALI